MNTTKLDEIQDVENVFIGAECEFDPKGHWIKVNDPHKLYKAILAWHNTEIAKAKYQAQVEALSWIKGFLDDPQMDGDHSARISREIDRINDKLADTESNKEGASNE